MHDNYCPRFCFDDKTPKGRTSHTVWIGALQDPSVVKETGVFDDSETIVLKARKDIDSV